MELIAIVGGSGFIGQRLSADLRTVGHNVTIVDIVEPPRGYPYRQADVRDRESLRRAMEGVNVVYNLAAIHRDDIVPITAYDEVNVIGAINVCPRLPRTRNSADCLH